MLAKRGDRLNPLQLSAHMRSAIIQTQRAIHTYQKRSPVVTICSPAVRSCCKIGLTQTCCTCNTYPCPSQGCPVAMHTPVCRLLMHIHRPALCCSAQLATGGTETKSTHLLLLIISPHGCHISFCDPNTTHTQILLKQRRSNSRRCGCCCCCWCC